SRRKHATTFFINLINDKALLESTQNVVHVQPNPNKTKKAAQIGLPLPYPIIDFPHETAAC
ncbi:hypothetical protein ACEWK1_23225, partial [Metabacillus sp. YM-086]|uniref:hypothetical protein n=1 Tax=Metabacillus sp. YM-086 TaxID=3341729 RepID=UPI003A83CC04